MNKILPLRWFIIISVMLNLISDFTFSTEIILNAENVVYDRENNKVVAEDNVKIKYKNVFIETQTLVYDIDKNVIYTTTDTLIIYNNNRLSVKNIFYDINSEKIMIHDFYSCYGPYYNYSKSGIVQKNEILLADAKVTHCNLTHPHYYFKSSTVVIYPQKKIKLYSPSMVVAGIPILWLPYYEISLRPSNDYFIIEPSYENEHGIITKIKYGRKTTHVSDFHFLFDTYGVDSVGTGIEYKYASSLYDGIIYGYLINEFTQKKLRWNIRVKNNHKFLDNWSFKSNLEFISDEQLYSQYEKQNWFIVRRDVNSSISISRDTQKTTLRLSYLRNDIYNQNQNKFMNNYYKTPLEFTIYPFSLWKFKLSESIKIIPTFIESTTYYNIFSENNFFINLPSNIFMFSLVPQAGIQTILTNSCQSLSDWYNIYNFILPVRYNLYGYGFAEVGYNYKIKSEKERLTVTFSSSSVIADNLQLRFDLYYKKSFLRTYLLYDFTQSIVSRWYQRFKPIITDVNISYKKFNFGSNIIYCIDKSLIENLQILISYLSSYGEVSLVYGINSSKPGLHFVSPQLNLYVPDNYQLKLRASLNISKEKFEVLNTNMEFYKDLHCLETKIFCNIKKSLSGNISLPYIFELGGSIGFKFKPYVGSGGKISDINQRYFPWRE